MKKPMLDMKLINNSSGAGGNKIAPEMAKSTTNQPKQTIRQFVNDEYKLLNEQKRQHFTNKMYSTKNSKFNQQLKDSLPNI